MSLLLHGTLERTWWRLARPMNFATRHDLNRGPAGASVCRRACCGCRLGRWASDHSMFGFCPPDLSATLIESSQMKGYFLREALRKSNSWVQGPLVARPFEETATVDADYITCRALDRFLPNSRA